MPYLVKKKASIVPLCLEEGRKRRNEGGGRKTESFKSFLLLCCLAPGEIRQNGALKISVCFPLPGAIYRSPPSSR